jgi:hypothetical protein
LGFRENGRTVDGGPKMKTGKNCRLLARKSIFSAVDVD